MECIFSGSVSEERLSRIMIRVYKSFLNGRIILKWILKKWAGVAWTGLVWFRIGTGAGSCECGNEPRGSIEMCGIFKPAEDLLASQEVLSPMELFCKRGSVEGYRGKP
jgi:hypothetical protein